MPSIFGPSNDVERIKAATDITSIIGEHIPLKPTGTGEYKGLCPFHEDHNPSLTVVPEKNGGFYKCFTCQAGGDAITFVQNYHALEFRDALEYLAQRAGVEISKRIEGRSYELERAAIEKACQFFEGNFEGSESERYLKGRGIKPETVELFRIGHAPNAWDSLLNHLSQDFNPELLERVGLIHPRRDGSGHFDFFRRRVVFPVQDSLGRVTGFAARALDPEETIKYMNTSRSPLYDKSSLLYGLHHSAKSIRKEGIVYVLEGYTDKVRSHQEGIHNTVATGGTAFTKEYAAHMQRVFKGVQTVFCFDGDEAGRAAAFRATKVMLGRGNTQVSLIPEEEDDPAKILERGRDLPGIINSHLQPAFDFYIETMRGSRDLSTAEGASTFLQDLRDPLRDIPSDVRDTYVETLSKRTGISPDSIRTNIFGADYRVQHSEGNGRASWEIELMRSIVANPSSEVIGHITHHVRSDHFSVLEARALFNYIVGNPEEAQLLRAMNAPLFRAQDVGSLLKKVYDESYEEGTILNKSTLRQLVNVPLAGKFPSMEDIDRAALMVRVHALPPATREAARRGNPIENIHIAIGSLEREIE